MTKDSHLDTFSETQFFDWEYPPWSATLAEPTTALTEKAGFGIRSIAYIIDRIILSVIGLLFFAAGFFALRTGSYIQTGIYPVADLAAALIPTYAAMLLIEMAYFTFFHGHTGQTLGKMCCRLQVVNTHGAVIGYRRAFVRWVGYIVSSLIFYLGFLWIAIDRNHRGWHDRIAGTYVIKL